MSSDIFLDLNKYKLSRFVGEGSFGEVFLVKEKKSNKIFAAKISLQAIEDHEPTSNEILFLFREIKIMSALDHPSIIQYVGYNPQNFDDEPYPTIVTEYAPGGTLGQFIELEEGQKPPEMWTETKKLINIYGIAIGMAYLHKNNILHRDLKPENILMTKELYPKISDFGLSKITDTISTSLNIQSKRGYKGTPLFMAPEILSDESYSKSSDVYAFSMLIYQIITGLKPFGNVSFGQLISKLTIGQRPFIPEDVPSVYRDLIERCWSQSPEDRPMFDEIAEVLRTNEDFITDKIDKKEFNSYVEMIDNYETSFNITKWSLHLSDFITSGSQDQYEIEDDHEPIVFPPDLFDELDKNSQQLVKSAENDSQKQFVVGRNLMEGREGFPKVINLAVLYLKKSMADHCDDSFLYLSKLLIDGKNILRNLSEARKILQKVNDQDSAEWHFLLGRIENKEEDYEEAAEHFKIASDKGHAKAMFKYGKMLLNGQGVEKDESKANEMFFKAKENGYTSQEIKYAKINLKISFVGDIDSGKHELIYYIINDKFNNFIPSIINDTKILYSHHGENVILNLVDTYGQEDYKQIRLMMYEKTDIFVFVYSLINKMTLKNIINKWNDDINAFRKNSYIILIGVDLDKWSNEGQSYCTQSEIDVVERTIQPNFSIKCSYLTGENLENFKSKLIESYVYNFYQNQGLLKSQVNIKSRRSSKKEFDFKVLLVGDENSGQFKLLHFIEKGYIPSDKVLSPLSRVDIQTSSNGRKVNLHLFGTPDDEKHQRIRMLSYPETDVILLVFSLIKKSSFHSLLRTFIKEVTCLAPNAALILVGVNLEKWNKYQQGLNFVKEPELDIFEQSVDLQKTILCSYVTGENLGDLYDQIIDAYLAKNGITDKSCTIE